MKVTLSGLTELDPLKVPLPHGTEVSTRVERVLDESSGRVVPEGAVGRVVGGDGERVEVLVVGVGRLVYARRELLPRRSGQLRFARRRAALWELLAPCSILRATVGSRAWGLAEEGSDIDVRGLFALPLPWLSGLGEREQDLTSLDGSATFWEIEKAIRQALRGDPNTLETLFVDSVTAQDEMGAWVLAAREAFVSVEIYGSFGRYALSQVKKLSQSLRLAEHRTLVLEWLRQDPGLSLDVLAERLARSTGLVHELGPGREADARLQAKQYVKQLYRSMYDQGLLPSAELIELATFARRDAHSFELPRELRPKNAYNLIRLLHTAIGWLESGAPSFAFRDGDPARDRLVAIKRGRVPLAEVLREAEALAPRLEEARRRTMLPLRADLARADALLRRVRLECARRHIGAAPGPFGADAPPVPGLEWSEEDHDESDD